MKIVIVGGGISGLSLAEAVLVRRPSAEVLVLEAEPRVGGKIWTDRTESGFLCEGGVNGFLDNKPRTLELAGRLKISPLRSNDASRKRFLYSGGRLHGLPESPPAFFLAGFLSPWGKLRLLAEPFIKKGTGEDETLAAFATRRLGREIFNKLIDPMASGIYAGDGRQLSLQSCFPRIHELEQTYGSLIRALVAIQRRRRREGGPKTGPGPGGVLTSFRDGMQTMINGLMAVLGDRVRTGCPVEAVAPRGDRWEVNTPQGVEEADRVVVASPAYAAGKILAGLDPDFGRILGGIPYPSVAVCCLGYRKEKVGHALDGFGYLIPAEEKRDILGSLWDSSIFPNRAPEGFVLLRSMLGGARASALAMRSEDEIADSVRKEIEDVLGITGTPDLVRVYRHERAIPQYLVGHRERLDDLDRCVSRFPGLSLTGNAYRGIGVNDCVARAWELADEITR